MEQKIKIEKDGNILAQHTTESCLSHYDHPVWVVIEDDPDPGCVIWRQGKQEQKLDFLEIVDGWFVAVQDDGNLIAIIWSDGYYYANLIHKRTNNQIANITDIDYVSNGLYQVFGTVPLGLLGCI